MKTFLILFGMAVCAAACDNKGSNNATADSNSNNDTTHVTYAYTLDHPNDWRWGSKKNTETVLNSLKAFEEGNIDECVKAFGDSVKLEFDKYEETLSKDSLTAVLKRQRADMKNMQIKMGDYESVKSPDGKEEYVSLWYKQINTGKNGAVDSVECMDDMKMKNGKIVLLNEKIRNYAVKKA